MRHDLGPQLKAVLNAYSLPILRATWVLDPEGCRDEVVQHCANDLGVSILGEDSKPGPARRRGVIWHRHLQQALFHLVYGHMPFELRYEFGDDGMLHLANLGPRMPWTIAQIHMNEDSTINEIVQTTQNTPLSARRLVWYVNQQEGANWAGISMLRPVFGAWLLKHEAWRTHATSIRRFGMGIPTVEAPPGATAGQVQEANNLAAGFRAGDQSGVGLPQGFKFALSGLTGSAPDALGFIQYLDRVMAKMALASLIELGQTETGSRALGDTFLDLFLMSLQGVADDLAVTATSGQIGLPGIVTDLVDVNWGTDEPAPRMVCTDVGENYDITAMALSQLTGTGALVPDPALDEWVRKLWRIPKRVTEWEPMSKGIPARGEPAGPVPVPGEEGLPTETGPAPKTPAVPPAPGSATPPAQPKARERATVRAARRALTPVEAASGHDPVLVQEDWATALDDLMTAYRAVVRVQRTDLVDQVIAAVQSGRPDRLASLKADPAPGTELVAAAMEALARTAANRMTAEAARQGVTIPGSAVSVKAGSLARVAQARAGLAAAYLSQQAGSRAMQTVRAAGGKSLMQQAMDSGDMIDTFLSGLPGTPLRDQLGAALTAAQNAGRVAALEAAPKTAAYTATEINDTTTCPPCRDIDGTRFADLADATDAYPNGGYLGCEGGLRCRGTVIAVWGDGVTATADAKYNPAQPRDGHGRWGHGGGKDPFKGMTDTEAMHAPGGKYTPERAALHASIVNGMLDGHKPQDHPVATFFGGGPASGKTALKEAAPDSAKIDSDAVKALLPEYQAMVKSGDPRAAMFAHEESSYIAKQAVKEAQKRSINFVLDGTGDSSFKSISAKVGAAKKAGYTVAGHYVTADVQTAVDRAAKRAARTGRMVPASVIREIHASVSRVYEEAAGKGLFDSTELWDNNGAKAVKIAHSDAAGKFVVDDPAAWQKFTAKGTPS